MSRTVLREMSIELTVTMIRALKGAPLSCLMILALAHQPLSAQYLERTSGYSDKTVNAALLLLEEYQLASRNGRYNWQISSQAKQFPLMDLAIEAPAEKNPDNLDNISGTRRNSVSESENLRLPTSSSRSLTSIKDQQLLQPIKDTESEKFRVDENKAVCDNLGIREPKRSSISSLENVTPRLIRYHCQKAPNLGAAIYRIEHAWEVPESWQDPGDVCAQTIIPAESLLPPVPLPADVAKIWENALENLQKRLSWADWKTWAVNMTLIHADLRRRWFEIRVINSFTADWLREHAVPILEKSLNGKVEIKG